MLVNIETNSPISNELVEQIKFLVATPIGTVVCDREFGINMEFIDKPTLTAETMFASELCQKLVKYIPEVKLDRVQFTTSEIGDKLTAKLVIKID